MFLYFTLVSWRLGGKIRISKRFASRQLTTVGMRPPLLLATSASTALFVACSGGGAGTGAGAGSAAGASGGATSAIGGATSGTGGTGGSRVCEDDCAKLPHVAGGAACDAGACAFTCMPGWAHCTESPGDGCETDLSQPSTCGACDVACTATAPACVPVGGGYACSTPCFNGTPVLCDGVCTDTTTDPKNCGGCGNACPPPSSCAGGKCT